MAHWQWVLHMSLHCNLFSKLTIGAKDVNLMHLMVQGTLKLPMIKDAVNLEPGGGQNLGVDGDKGKLFVSIPLTSQYRLSTDTVQTRYRQCRQ